MSAARDRAHLLAAARNRRAVARDAPRLHGQPDQPPPGSLCLDLDEGRAADELALVELHRPAETRLVRVDRLVHVVAVQAEGGLQARGVAGAEAGRQHARLATVLEDGVPHLT